ncbi:MAG TPA: hypothetical protein DCQ64_15985 [Candidatus Rokubacteria bacterium]|nr:hypothetical protein [Candidatus Rokubacteria bacterium]
MVTGTGDGGIGGPLYVEGILPLPGYCGTISAYKLRRTAGAGNPAWQINSRTGQTDTTAQYRASTAVLATGSADIHTALNPPTPFTNQDATKVKRLYAVFNNDGGAGDASTWVVSVLVEVDPDDHGARQ